MNVPTRTTSRLSGGERFALVATQWLLGGLLALSADWQGHADAAASKKIDAPQGQKLYLQFSLFAEEGVHRTTNYRKGILFPVNTEVAFVKATKKDVYLSLPDGTKLKLANVQDFSGEPVTGIFKRTLATTRVDLEQFTEAERKAIRAGVVEVGMTKAAVLVAIGYPPKHKTPSLEGDSWRYWQNRINTFLVKFREDKVVAIVN